MWLNHGCVQHTFEHPIELGDLLFMVALVVLYLSLSDHAMLLEASTQKIQLLVQLSQLFSQDRVLFPQRFHHFSKNPNF
jgi:hypothetical protein